MEKRMLWLGVVVMVVGLCSSGALATTMGTPVATLKAQQISIGPVYSISDMDLEIDGDFEVLMYDVGAAADLPTIEGSIKGVKGFESNMIFANLGYGVSDMLEVFVRLGLADLSLDEADFSGSNAFAWGLGAKATFYEEENLQLGGLFQITFGSSDGEITIDNEEPGRDIDTDVDWYEIKIALGPSYQLMEGVSVYGGPFYHLFSGDIDGSKDGDYIDDGDLIEYETNISFDLNEDSSFGGYIGAQIDLAENLPLCVEYQFTGGANIFGASLVYRF